MRNLQVCSFLTKDWKPDCKNDNRYQLVKENSNSFLSETRSNTMPMFTYMCEKMTRMKLFCNHVTFLIPCVNSNASLTSIWL